MNNFKLILEKLSETIHPKTQQLLNYPDSKGKRIAMKHFKWDKLTKEEEVMYVDDILKMAKSIDEK